MKTLKLALLALAFASCGEDTSNQEDMTIPPDLAMSVDMAMQVPNGVVCGNMTCSTSMVCCIKRGTGMAVTQTCMAPGSCGDGAAEARCDGPEDCSPAQPNCCVNIKLAMGMDGGAPDPTGGSAMCITDCPANADIQGTTVRSVQTKLCRSETDCENYQGFVAFDGCCQTTMLPGVKFCAPKGATFQNLGRYTCP